MHVEAKIQKWGNGLALRVSGVMREIPGFQEGAIVDVEVTEAGLVVRKRQEPSRHPLPFSEEALLAELDKKSAHADLLAEPLPQELPE